MSDSSVEKGGLEHSRKERGYKSSWHSVRRQGDEAGTKKYTSWIAAQALVYGWLVVSSHGIIPGDF
jgi:hypothetical protein